MDASAGQHWERHHSDSKALEYTSHAMELFTHGLGETPDARILDLGPVCSENIRFFASRITKLYVCDLFIRLNVCSLKKYSPSLAWKDLDYPPETFDGILLWDLVNRVGDPELKTLVELCHVSMKPGGKLVLLTLGDRVPFLPAVSAFVLSGSFRLHARPQLHLDLPLYSRQTREVMELLHPFRLQKSFIYRNGILEGLFQSESGYGKA